MADEKQKQEFSTLDIYLAAFLTIKGIDSRPEVDSSGKVVFLFNKEDVDNHIDEYHSPITIIPVQKFVREIKWLRSLMNQMRPKKGGK